jgi:chromosome segregation ATPase
VPFGLFSKKKDDEPAAARQSLPDVASSLSVHEAQEVLRRIESAKVQELSARLAPISQSVAQSLATIGRLADEMGHEKIKLEDLEQRFRTVVENSRKTVVSTLKREASAELALPQSINDVKKFREKFEAMMNRFGEVTGSHSKTLNIFMKKHASKIKEELESLTELLKQTRAITSDFEQERAPVVKCGTLLNTISQKASSVRLDEASTLSAEKEIEGVEGELKKLEEELAALKGSPEFGRALVAMQSLGEAEKRQEQFRSEVGDLFSRASRAFTKYSYGITRETEMRLQAMSDEPWKILSGDVSPYLSLLLEIRKSIDSGKIQLKDSDKVLQYVDAITGSLPELQAKAGALQAEIDSLRQGDSGAAFRARDLEGKIAHYSESLAQGRQAAEQQKRQIADKNAEIQALLKEAAETLSGLTGQKHALTA